MYVLAVGAAKIGLTLFSLVDVMPVPLQVYVVAPIAVKLIEPLLHTVEGLAFAVTVGTELTVIVI
jgi:hypothetical protein